MPATPIKIAGAKYAWEIVPPGGSIKTIKVWKLDAVSGRTNGFYYVRLWRAGVKTCSCESFNCRAMPCKHIEEFDARGMLGETA